MLQEERNEIPGRPQSSLRNLSVLLERLAHWLPSQAPLKDFIHHNTLHAFQDRPFHEALRVASRLYGTRNYLPLAEYRRLYESGDISASGLARALEAVEPDERQRVESRLFDASDISPFPGVSVMGTRARWKRERHLSLDTLVHPILFRLLSSYLDQGVSLWRMPHADDRLWSCVRRLVAESLLPFGPLSDPGCRRYLEMDPVEAIEALLARIVGNRLHFESYLLEMLLAHPGWSGIVAVTEQAPSSLTVRRPVKLHDAVAVELLLELGWLERKLGRDFAPLVRDEESAPVLPTTTVPRPMEAELIASVWQEALEWSHYEQVLQALEQSAGERLSGERDEIASPSAQMFFCIDDRECSFRRHLEELDPNLETFAVAGFFGIDWLFQAVGAGTPTKLCPAPVTPRYLVRELAPTARPLRRPRLAELLHLSPSNTLFRGWLITQVLGIWHALKLAKQVFLPSKRRPIDQALSHIEPQGELALLRTGEDRTEEGLFLGFSLDEMVDRVHGVLTSTGCTRRFSRLVIFVAHGASSVNNPYFAAYDCGACSGRPGAPNARAIAQMANDPRVREALRAKGLQIPDDTVFLGALHDTTRDEVVYFDVEKLPPSHRPDFESVRRTVEKALLRNAHERCRKLPLCEAASPEQALQHVRERAASIFEPRPELNHANNDLCIIGRRTLTRGIFFDRRAFLNSYDPTQDPSGDVLLGVLAAAVPVCAGINLEYYFSRVDSRRYGSGTKLPHNVMGLIGVANGTEGDLQTGLPTQMTEMHDPLRLLVVVEQEPEIVSSVLFRGPSVLQWVRNDWVRFVCLSPSTGTSSLYVGDRFVPIEWATPLVIPMATDSSSLSRGRVGNIPVTFLGGSR